MGQRKMVNEASIGNSIGTLHKFPGLEAIGKENQPERVPFTWAQKRLLDLGVYVMPENSPQPPPGFYVNFSTVTFLILVIGTIAGLWLYTWRTADQGGYERGRQEAVIQQLKEQATAAEKKAEAADTKATYAVSGSDEAAGHKPEKSKQK